jgi:light-regulated signal transduction histidine kinase (bacteriophytochrome)
MLPTDLEEVLEQVLINLKVSIEESSATLTHDPLPRIYGDRSQMVQLWQNLCSNAIKFRSDRPLEIHLGVQRQDSHWLFWVQDNGIGIDPRYAERIFVLFQRLHTQSSFPGTGIGLAICHKIIMRHGGKIWVESNLNQGATFYFTIADRT